MDMFVKSVSSPLAQQMSPMMSGQQQGQQGVHAHHAQMSPMHVQQQSSPMMQSQQSLMDSSLKMTISLKGHTSKTPFHLMRSEWPGGSGNQSDMTAAKNLMACHGLEHSYVKLTTKKLKASLSSYLSNMPGVMDSSASLDNSSLRAIIEKPPVVGKELHSLNQLQLAGFRLHPGPLPEQYRSMAQGGSNNSNSNNAANSRRNSRGHVMRSSGSRRSNKRGSEVSLEEKGEEGRGEERRKKHKRHDKDADERRKRKKEKKKKKYKEDKQEGA